MNAALAQAGGAIPSLTPEIVLIFAVIGVALALFVTGPIPIDVTAVAVLVALIVLEPWTGIDPETGIGGFSSPATVTVLAMFVLSEGIRQSGLVNIVGAVIADRFGDSQFKQLLALLGLAGGSAGFINNTPVVAIMIPMVNTISKKTGISPSKLLLPVSYIAMLGGMLTVIGTSTNILASDLSGRLLGRPFGMFEFTQLGVIVLLIGGAYLLTVGRFLLPDRVAVEESFFEEFGMAEYLTEVVVEPDADLIGDTVGAVVTDADIEAEALQLIRGDRTFVRALDPRTLRAGDILVLRANQDALLDLIEAEGLGVTPAADVTQQRLERAGPTRPTATQRLVEVVVSPGASLVGKTLDGVRFDQRYEATVLAIRRGERLLHSRMRERALRGGDTLLVRASEGAISRFANDRDFVLARELVRQEFRTERIPVALGIVVGVVAVAAAGLLSIVVSALAGVVAMVVTGCVTPEEMYEAVDWSVIFLIAGLVPLGIAMERTGGAQWLADLVVAWTAGLSPILVLGIFYLFTALITEVVSNNASVVLMIPIAIDTATAIGSEPFSFVLAVTFAASTAILTPIGYQTNLMVYGPGGYAFSDFFRVGAPLQVLLAVVSTVGIAVFFGV